MDYTPDQSFARFEGTYDPVTGLGWNPYPQYVDSTELTAALDGATGGATANALIYKGDWVADTSYVLNDVVMYDGSAYVVTGTIGDPSVNPSASIPVTFDDDFNRADGAVENGWTSDYGTQPVIVGGRLVSSGGVVGNIVRPLGSSGTVTATFAAVSANNSTYIDFRNVHGTSFLWAGRDGLRYYTSVLASWPNVAAGTVMEVEFTETQITVRGNGAVLADMAYAVNASATGVGVGVGSTGAIDDFHYSSTVTGGWTPLSVGAESRLVAVEDRATVLEARPTFLVLPTGDPVPPATDPGTPVFRT